jgi:transmembrane sensor
VRDDNFRRWVLFPDADTDIFWIGWINNNPEKEYLIQNAKEIILSFKINEPQITDNELTAIIEDTLDKINRGVEEIESTRKIKGKIHWLALSGIAAILVAGLFIGIHFYKAQPPSIYQQLVTSSQVILTQQSNYSGAPMQIKLDDGSIIILQNKSTLCFPKTFSGKKNRTVYLNGDASFSIAKNPSKPFLVYANGIVTKVLGTKFIIHSFDTDKKAIVEVISGIVSVNAFKLNDLKPENSHRKEDAVILTRNQQVVYNAENQRLEASITQNPKIIDDALNMQYQFTNTDMEQVVATLKKHYGIDIIYDEKTLSTKTVTADLRNTTLFQKLDVICKILDCHYEIIDRKIFINPQN